MRKLVKNTKANENRHEIRFLVEPDLRREAKRIISASKRTDLAVAFWGREAVRKLGITSNARVICDLESGACNPEEIALLKSLPKVQVRNLRKLHAKVYWTPDEVIVGSANASTNGLGEEDAEGRGTVEAAILTTDQSTISAVSRWFNRMWTKATPVDDEDIKAARPAFERHRNTRIVRDAKSLLTRLREEPEWFKDRGIHLVAYTSDEDNDDWAIKKNRSERHRRSKSGNPVSSAKVDIDDLFYQDENGWPVKPGDIYVDYSVNKSKTKATLRGLYQVLLDDPFIPKGKQPLPRIILVKRLKEVPGLIFPKREQRELGNAISRYLLSSKVTEDKYGCYIDKPLDAVSRLRIY